MKQSNSIMDNMKVNSLSVGDSGKGKTHFIGSIIDCGFKPYIIDAEGGVKTIANKVFDYEQVNTWAAFLVELAWFYNNYKEKGYTHLVIDSISRLQQYLAAEICKDGKLTMNQWGEVLANLRSCIDKLTKTCPTNLHMTSMAMEAKDELTGMTKIYPNIQGAFKFDLAGYFDVVLYHDCGEKDGSQRYWVQTQADTRVTTARSRLDCIKKMAKFEQSNYSIIADIINKGGK